MSFKKWHTFVGIFLICLSVGYIIYMPSERPTSSSHWIGREIPSFSLNSLGSSMDFNQEALKGTPCLLTFFCIMVFFMSCRT